MGMIVYAMIHPREHDRNEEIAPFDERENLTGLLISDIEKCTVVPIWNDMNYHLFESVNITRISRKRIRIYKDDLFHALY